MAKDVRKEQLVLLKFEKKLTGLAAFWGASATAAAAAASVKMDPDATAGAYENVRAALVHLAEVTAQAHASLDATASAAGARALEAGGTPKVSVLEMVRSVLGLG
ncbi:MAG: hypothetical protein KDD85_08500 [Parvularculaceae bacterium]|nr:hypothetical protein [Parvularculaceae bacterium]